MFRYLKVILLIKYLKYYISFIFLDILFVSGIILANLFLSYIKNNNNNSIRDIRNEIFQNDSFPMFHFYIGLESPSKDFSSYDSFYTWQGTKKEKNHVKINKIFSNQFFYEKSNKTYFDYLNLSVKEGENCNDNYKKCGILDSKKNILCLPENEECPLNYFKISDFELFDLLPEYNHIELIESITGIKKYIYFTNNKIDNDIITNFKISFDKPCIVSKEHNWISMNRNENEKSSNCFTSINGQLHDKSYTEVGDNIHMKSLYYDNNIKTFNDYSSEKVKLYTKSFNYIKEDCSYNFINVYEKLFMKIINNISNFKIIGYINSILLIIHFIVFCYGLKNRKKNIIVLIILNILILYLIIINSSIVSIIHKERIIEFDCSEEDMNQKINYIIKQLLLFQKKSKLIIFIVVIISVIELIIQNYAFLQIYQRAVTTNEKNKKLEII